MDLLPFIKPPDAGEVVGLIRAFNFQNTRVINNPQTNPYLNNADLSKPPNKDKELYKSSLGTPVVTDLTLKGGSYTSVGGQKITFNDIKFALVLISVSQSKRIVETEIQGSDAGDVIEYIGMSNYQININGIFSGGNGHYPIEDVNALHQLLKAPVAINVVSTYLGNLDIFNIVVKDFALGQDPGGYSQQAFSIQAISDTPVELITQ